MLQCIFHESFPSHHILNKYNQNFQNISLIFNFFHKFYRISFMSYIFFFRWFDRYCWNMTLSVPSISNSYKLVKMLTKVFITIKFLSKTMQDYFYPRKCISSKKKTVEKVRFITIISRSSNAEHTCTFNHSAASSIKLGIKHLASE